MAQHLKQDGPASASEAFAHGMRIGLELNEARKIMRECIAHRLQTCRLAARLTQQELAIKIDINYLTYRGYENCKSDIPIVYLVRLADFYGVSMDYLTGRTEDKNGNCAKPVESVAQDTDLRIAQLEKMVAQLMSGKTENN